MKHQLKVGMMRSERLREMREARQLSQQDLADRIGVSMKQVWRYENSLNVPAADILLRIARELEVSMDYLAGLTDEPVGHAREEELSPTERKLVAAYRRGDLRELMQVASNRGE